MTNLINSNSNNYNISNYGIKQPDIKETLEKSKQTVNESVSGNSAVLAATGGVNDADTRNKTLALVPALYYADRFVNSKIAGNEAKGFLGRLAGFGDKISSLFNLDKIISKKSSHKVSNFIKNNNFTKYFTDDYKAIAKCSMAKTQSMAEKYTDDLVRGLGELVKNEELLNQLTSADSPIKDTTKALLDKILNNENTNKIPFKDLINATDDIIEKSIDTVKKGSLLSQPINLSELRNKAKAANLETGKSGLGKLFAKLGLKTKDTITYGGGLLSAYFMASSIINATKATKEAPEGEKLSTFMHVLSEQYIGMILFQPSINMLYKAGGNKYRGMTIDARKALADLVKTANANPNLTKEGLKIANIQKKLLLKGVDEKEVAKLAGKTLKEVKEAAKTLKNNGVKLKPWEKLLKSLGTILDTGLDTIKRTKNVKLPLIGEKKISMPTLKGFLGGFGRFAIIMFVLQPLLQKPLTKLCHKIFGKPTEYLKKQNQPEEKQTLSTDNLNTIENQNTNLYKNSTSTNLIDIWTKNNNQKQNTNSTINTSNQNQQDIQKSTTSVPPSQPIQQDEIAALNLFNKDKKEAKQQERYIPSTDVTYETAETDAMIEAKLDEIRKEAYKAKAKIEKYL